jgi:hypothetical protein
MKLSVREKTKKRCVKNLWRNIFVLTSLKPRPGAASLPLRVVVEDLDTGLVLLQ